MTDSASIQSEGLRPNVATEEGRALGRKLARLCDGELKGKADNRCQTCAFRAGDHIANGSPETLMTALNAPQKAKYSAATNKTGPAPDGSSCASPPTAG